MTGARQDGWTEDEDVLLAEVVLRHIRDGSTQLKAFEEIGRELSRSAAACGFRWNSTVRKQYKSGIELAKKKRKEMKQSIPKVEPKPAEIVDDVSVMLGDCINYLSFLQMQLGANPVLSYLKMKEENEQMKQRVLSLLEQQQELEHTFNELNQDYHSLLTVLERARKLAVKENELNEKVRFQMDKNGNLERV